MLNCTYWHYIHVLKSVYLSKNYIEEVKDIPSIKKIKICIFFSKKIVRSSILVFWFLFLIFGKRAYNKKLTKPEKRIIGVSAKQTINTIKLFNIFDIYSFVNLWSKKLALRNLIYLRKKYILKGSAFMQYSKVLRPKKYPQLMYLDYGCDYFISKTGFFQIYISFWSMTETKYKQLFNISAEELDDLAEGFEFDSDEVDTNNFEEIYSHESTAFYLKSCKI